MNHTSFKPSWWLPGPHLQTIWSALFRRKRKLPVFRERLELPDRDFLDLEWAGEENNNLVLILHGVAGSSQSSYAQGMLSTLVAAGWQAVFLHFRGCSQEPNRLERGYHAGETEDLNYVVQTLLKRRKDVCLAIVGVSLGGSVLLKWLGEQGKEAPVVSAVAISVPFDLANVANRFNKGLSRVYQWWLLRELKRGLLKKTNLIPSDLSVKKIRKIKSFWEFDEQITAPMYGFKNAAHYYQLASARQYLKGICKPTLILHAADDPFMTPEAIPLPGELSPEITMELTLKGGHVGFIGGQAPWKATSWLEERIPLFLQRFFTAKGD